MGFCHKPIVKNVNSCEGNLGGVTKIKIEEVNGATANWIATGVVLKADSAYSGESIAASALVPGTTYYKAANVVATVNVDYGFASAPIEFDVMPESSHFESVYSYTASTGIGVWTTTLFIKIGEITATNKSSIDSLTLNNVKITAKLGNGKFVSIGTDDLPAYVTGGNMNTGTALEDDHGYDLTFTAKSANALVVNDTEPTA